MLGNRETAGELGVSRCQESIRTLLSDFDLIDIPPFELAPDEVRIWPVSLLESGSELESLEATLTPDEVSRADRFVTEELRRRYVVSRGALRRILSAGALVPPADIRFRYEQWGKPQLATTQGCQPKVPLHFNVSHSADVALFAVSMASVGIDVEVPNDRINHRAIASQVLSQSEEKVWSVASRQDLPGTLMNLWVCKEALLKAMGLGIADGLKQISFPLPIPGNGAFAPDKIDAALQLHLDDDGSCRMNDWTDTNCWRLQLLECIPGAYAAVCTQRSVTRLTIAALET